MVFSSLIFLYAFFPLSLLAYFLCKGRRAQNAVLLVSSELTEIMSLSDRIYVIYEGRINGEFKRNSMDDKHLGLLMVGGSIENE